MKSPYSDLPSKAFWRSAVTDRPPLEPGDLYEPRFKIDKKMKVVTAGSCFAQHVGRTLRNAGYNVLDAETAPRGMPVPLAQKYGYGMYSARYGNIYTSRQLLQLWREATGDWSPANPIWEKNGRFYDALRPNVEPEGLPTPESVKRHRDEHLAHVVDTFKSADLFVFTFGLTECWEHTASGTIYPTAPGTIAGEFDPDVYAFKNLKFSEVYADFMTFRGELLKVNPNMKFLITVSPVPLTATATGKHVEVATVYSKAVLRTACGEIYDTEEGCDYFPSYEIITSTNNRGVYYEPNKRSVSPLGVEKAMGLFLKAHGGTLDAAVPAPSAGAKGSTAKAENDVVCEEALLEAFGR